MKKLKLKITIEGRKHYMEYPEDLIESGICQPFPLKFPMGPMDNDKITIGSKGSNIGLLDLKFEQFEKD